MTEVVAYDIASPARLRRVARLCEDFGIRIEKSVFECRLDPEDFQRFWTALTAISNRKEDVLTAYPLCNLCRERIISYGQAVRPDFKQVYLF